MSLGSNKNVILIVISVGSFLLALLTISWLTWRSLDDANAERYVEDGNVITGEVGDHSQYQIGTGIADITGPAAEIGFMGYASFTQLGSGIHLRLYSRAVILIDDTGNRVVYITADLEGITQIVKLEVVKTLRKKYQDLYSENNILMSATHTHSGPGGYFQYLLYIITTQGFIPESFHAIVDGVVRSVVRAHQSLKPGYIYFNEGELLDSAINRSPPGYANNPKEERDRYKHDTDKTMSILKLVDTSGRPIGMINWHAVHGTSMNNSNTLVSSDNKGYASLLMEKEHNKGKLLGKGPFVAIFSNTNEGDASPNTLGARCIDTGLPCDKLTATCNGKNEFCIAFGPGKDMFESTSIIARLQYEKAKELFDNAKEKISGPIRYIHQHIDMANFTVKLDGSKKIKTCRAALGFSFAAGTTDGPGAEWFHQGTKAGEAPPLWNLIKDFIKKPSSEMVECQKPKAILLAVGEMYFPYQWAPNIIPTQLLQIGNVVIAGLPAEFTTMSGRRMRNAIHEKFADAGQVGVHVMLSGLANTYSNYVATYEEYQVQMYEGGSTLYGPHTLDAYIQQFTYLADNMANKRFDIPFGPSFPNLLNKQITLKPPVIFDSAMMPKNFGDVLTDVKSGDYVYSPGSTVKVRFVGASPRNNLKLEGTFLTVERLNPMNMKFDVIATDADWETKFEWTRTNVILGYSEVTITWEIPNGIPSGTYRIRYFGDHKDLLQPDVHSFIGTSSNFKVSSGYIS